MCAPYTTIETLQLRYNTWRLSNRTLDARQCITSGDKSNSPCVGGSQSGPSEGGGYCIAGHQGPLCQGCMEKDHHYIKHRQSCERCGDDLFWLETFLDYALPLLLVGAASP